MDTNDFLGSFDQENVLFSTQVVKTAAVGDNFYKVMIFVENSRFVDASSGAWITVPGSSTIKALTVTAADYAEYTSGLLQSWLYDLFCSGFTGDCILVACGDISATYTAVTNPTGDPQAQGWYVLVDGQYVLTTDTEVQSGTTYYTASTDLASFIEDMDTAYELMKAYAYHKTVCAGTDTSVDPTIAVELATLCGTDSGLLSGVPLLPFTTTTPETPETDPLYNALKLSGKDAFMSANQDSTRNASLLSLGIALSTYNGSGTPVGNNMEMTATGMITSSGANGGQLSKTIRDTLAGVNVQTWKPVGDNTGNVAAYGASTLNGDLYSATWILAYITYMVKVRVAQMLTEGNFLKNAANYSRIISVMNGICSRFVDSGRLENYVCTAPSYEDLPEAASDEIVVPDAWSATYITNVRKVTITGTLYIGA
jgi:hypothetical protein